MVDNQTTLEQDEMMHCIVDGAAGIFVPQSFAQRFDLAEWGIDKEDIDILLAGPDHEHYWDTWDTVLSNASYGNKDGVWYLNQDGDLFIVHEDYNWDAA